MGYFKVGFCITHEIICDSDELMKKHNSAEHEKIWIEFDSDLYKRHKIL